MAAGPHGSLSGGFLTAITVMCVVLILTLVIGTLLIAGKTNGGSDPMEALRSAMIIGALPFTLLMGLMCVSLGKAMWCDHLRETKSPV